MSTNTYEFKVPTNVNTFMSGDCQFGAGGFHTMMITSKDSNDPRCFNIRYDDFDGTPEGQIYTIEHTNESFKSFNAAVAHLVAKEKI